DKTLSEYAAPEIIVGGDREVEDFNENEMSIIKCFLENPKIRLTHLARSANLNVKTATAIFKNLQKRRVIKGFKYLIDPNKLGIYHFRLFLQLHNVSQEKERGLLDYMKDTREVVQINKTVGDWDMEIDIQSSDKARIRQLIVQIREKFKDLIETFNLIEFYTYYKKSYLPIHLFNKEGEDKQ
ncbi:MAG: Lrp/AsnC family transcriptional regulator, partial [Candidatus Woesearchaeota archaeon]|nr:Lrp/AsnC family transcriptional regulator [Candidatus Woesearchaeota archaeon]